MSDESPYDKQIKKFLLPMLRRKSLWWPERSEALKLSRRERGFYECASCHKLFGRKEVNLDHIYPVINVKTSWVNWDHFIRSLLPFRDGWQVLCIACHDSKTAIETELRKLNRRKKLTKKVKK